MADAGMSWRWMPLLVAEGAEQLARTEAMMLAVGEGKASPSLRWYSYSRPALVLGYGQPAHDVDLEACRGRGIPVLRRPAGGAAVLADSGLLGLAVALPLPHPLVTPDVTESYRWLGEVLASGLRELGVRARVVSVAEARADGAAARSDGVGRLRLAACFGSFSPYEVAVGPRKVVGLAQVRRRNVALYQCGVLLRFDGRLLASLLSGASGHVDLVAQELRARTTDLETELGGRVEAGAVVDALSAAFASRLGVRLELAGPTLWELEKAAELQAEKYAPLGPKT